MHKCISAYKMETKWMCDMHACAFFSHHRNPEATLQRSCYISFSWPVLLTLSAFTCLVVYRAILKRCFGKLFATTTNTRDPLNLCATRLTPLNRLDCKTPLFTRAWSNFSTASTTGRYYISVSLFPRTALLSRFGTMVGRRYSQACSEYSTSRPMHT